MIPFVDPRSSPGPPPQVFREPAAHGEEVADLTRLCSAGRVYAAERWIQEDRPIQARTYRRPKKPALVSPLRAAIRENNLDLVLLLLCNGYRLDLEENDRGTVLDEALTNRAFEILELLLKWGADPTKVSGENVIDTYRSDLIERFWKAGVDYTAEVHVPSKCGGVKRTNRPRLLGPWPGRLFEPSVNVIGPVHNGESLEGRLGKFVLPQRARGIAGHPVPHDPSGAAPNRVLLRPFGPQNLTGKGSVRIPVVARGTVRDLGHESPIRPTNHIGQEYRLPHDEHSYRTAGLLQDSRHRGGPPQAGPSGRREHQDDSRPVSGRIE